MGINEYDELRGENIALRREAEELRAQLEIAHGALDESERAIAAAREEGRAAGIAETKNLAADEVVKYYRPMGLDASASIIVSRILSIAPAATTDEPK